MTGSAVVLHGNALALPLADESVDLVVTSPPYFGLRDYRDGGGSLAGQIGSEATPAEFIDALVAATAEMVRVLKPSGSIFVNLGDKYSQRTQTRRSSHQPGIFPGKFEEFGESWAARAAQGAVRMPHQNVVDAESGAYVPEKSLMLLPERYRIACVDRLGLIARAVICWDKPNGLPESVTDRVRRSHEDWAHLTKQPRYYEALDEIREPPSGYVRSNATRPTPNGQRRRAMADDCNPLGRLPGSVWTIPTQPLRAPEFYGVLGGRTVTYLWSEDEARAWLRATGVSRGRPSVRRMEDHFAAFPMAWPRRIIRGWSPPGVCVECGEGRRPVVVTTRTFDGQPIPGGRGAIFDGAMRRKTRNQGVGNWRFGSETLVTGYACACPDTSAPTRPAVVVDPFGGTGTTALVARAWGRRGITVDLSRAYCRLATWRVNDPGELARAAEVEPPPRRPAQPPPPDGEPADLLDLLAMGGA